MSTRLDARDDGGFSLVEVMIALAITAAMSMGIGGLVVFGAQVRDRITAASDIGERLVALTALSAGIERLATMTLAMGDDDAFILTRNDRVERLRIELVDGVLVAGTATSSAASPAMSDASRIDLSVFDVSKLEYLHRENEGDPIWDAPARPGALAARIVVAHGARSWPIILWLRPRSLSS